MTNFIIKMLIVFSTILFITGFAVYVFAHGGGYHMRANYTMMNGYQMNGGGHMWNYLSAKDQKKMQLRRKKVSFLKQWWIAYINHFNKVTDDKSQCCK